MRSIMLIIATFLVLSVAYGAYWSEQPETAKPIRGGDGSVPTTHDDDIMAGNHIISNALG